MPITSQNIFKWTSILALVFSSLVAFAKSPAETKKATQEVGQPAKAPSLPLLNLLTIYQKADPKEKKKLKDKAKEQAKKNDIDVKRLKGLKALIQSRYEEMDEKEQKKLKKRTTGMYDYYINKIAEDREERELKPLELDLFLEAEEVAKVKEQIQARDPASKGATQTTP